MGVFRFADKYSAPTKEQRERYMIGKVEERHYGPEGEIVLIEYHDAIYLKDDINNVRILFTGFKDKQTAHEEVKRLVELHRNKKRVILFTNGQRSVDDSKTTDHKSG